MASLTTAGSGARPAGSRLELLQSWAITVAPVAANSIAKNEYSEQRRVRRIMFWLSVPSGSTHRRQLRLTLHGVGFYSPLHDANEPVKCRMRGYSDTMFASHA